MSLAAEVQALWCRAARVELTSVMFRPLAAMADSASLNPRAVRETTPADTDVFVEPPSVAERTKGRQRIGGLARMMVSR